MPFKSSHMTWLQAIGVLQDLLDTFPEEKLLHALEADAGPGFRLYSSGRLTDAQVRQAREALDYLRRNTRTCQEREA